MESIIGKKYQSLENSYSKCLSDATNFNYPKKYQKRYYLAGTSKPRPGSDPDDLDLIDDIKPSVVTIISEPFDCKIYDPMMLNSSFEKMPMKMVLVKDSNDLVHSVLYYKSGLL